MPFGRGPASQGTRAGGDETQAHGTKVRVCQPFRSDEIVKIPSPMLSRNISVKKNEFRK